MPNARQILESLVEDEAVRIGPPPRVKSLTDREWLAWKDRLTPQQWEALGRVRERWDWVADPGFLPLEKCLMVHVGSNETGAEMWLGIETDGHTHS
jgi:hypothetical protein